MQGMLKISIEIWYYYKNNFVNEYILVYVKLTKYLGFDILMPGNGHQHEGES